MPVTAMLSQHSIVTASTYIYSQLSSESVRYLVSSQYGLDKNITCRFYVFGLHDNYLIESNGQKFILRIYRNSWRSEEEILFELEWLVFLNRKTDLVAELIETKHGNLMFQIDSPEGSRLASMFRYAEGKAPGNTISAKVARLLGKTVAIIHNSSDVFMPQYKRQALDIPYLLDDSINDIKPYLDKEGFSYLCNIRERLNTTMPRLEKAHGIYGLCIGVDLH